MAWYKCEKYALEIDSDNFAFSLNARGEDGTRCHLQPATANEDKDLVKKALWVIANAWPDSEIQFQCNETGKIADISVELPSYSPVTLTSAPS